MSKRTTAPWLRPVDAAAAFIFANCSVVHTRPMWHGYAGISRTLRAQKKGTTTEAAVPAW